MFGSLGRRRKWRKHSWRHLLFGIYEKYAPMAAENGGKHNNGGAGERGSGVDNQRLPQ